MIEERDKEIQKHKQLGKQLMSQLAEVEVQGQKYKKSYEKAKAYTTELEQSIIQMDQKIQQMKVVQKNEQLVNEIEDINTAGAEGKKMADLSTELIQIKALSKSILEISPESSDQKSHNSLAKLENGLSPVPMYT